MLLSELRNCKGQTAARYVPAQDYSDSQSESGDIPQAAVADNAKLAVRAMTKIVGQIRACNEWAKISRTKEKKPRFFRMHWGPPSDVRFDVVTSDSLVAPFEGIVEFSIRAGVSRYSGTVESANTAPDMPLLSLTTRHRHVFRIGDSGAQLDHRSYYRSDRQDWVLEQGESDFCWEHINAQ